MKKFNIKVGDRKFIVKAKDNIDAVIKLKSKLADKSLKDYSYVDPKHYAEYGWKIEKDLYRDCYWEAVEQLAGKLKSEEEYKREIPKLARQIFDKHVKEIQAEINKLIAIGKSQTSNYDKWAVEQAQNIMKKQGKDSAEELNKLEDARVKSREQAYAIEKAARQVSQNNISIGLSIDADKDGTFIKEMYVNTPGKWLDTPASADEFLRDLQNVVKFFKENYKYVGKN